MLNLVIAVAVTEAISTIEGIMKESEKRKKTLSDIEPEVEMALPVCGPVEDGRCLKCLTAVGVIRHIGCLYKELDEERCPSKEEGSTASYYELPEGSKEFQDIISYLDCNAQMGEIGRAWMRYGKCSHSPKLRDINKIIFYAQEEKKRLLKYDIQES